MFFRFVAVMVDLIRRPEGWPPYRAAINKCAMIFTPIRGVVPYK